MPSDRSADSSCSTSRPGLGSDDLTAQRFHAVRAHLLDQLGDPHGAAEHFRTAASLTSNAVERTYLLEQAASAEAERP